MVILCVKANLVRPGPQHSLNLMGPFIVSVAIPRHVRHEEELSSFRMGVGVAGTEGHHRNLTKRGRSVNVGWAWKPGRSNLYKVFSTILLQIQSGNHPCMI
jgi:hypothetical protein